MADFYLASLSLSFKQGEVAKGVARIGFPLLVVHQNGS